MNQVYVIPDEDKRIRIQGYLLQYIGASLNYMRPCLIPHPNLPTKEIRSFGATQHPQINFPKTTIGTALPPDGLTHIKGLESLRGPPS